VVKRNEEKSAGSTERRRGRASGDPLADREPGDGGTLADRLDVRGLLCPIPILRTAQRMRTMPAGARLEVVGDDPGIVEDMPVWCEETGNRLLGLEREGDLVRCVVEKRG
jgi:tRNA 2-thiouridine synthesizing protein A